jgi:RimJ/RimL family protein N-acetyltransferase
VLDGVALDEVVRLRPLRVSDAAAHLAGCDRAIIDALGGGIPPTPGEIEDWLLFNASAWADAGPVVDLGIVEIASGTLAGCVGIQRGLDYLSPGQVNLSYALYPAFRGRGLATRSVRLAMEVARARGSVREFVIQVAPENVESVRVAERLGFQLERTEIGDSERVSWYVTTEL